MEEALVRGVKRVQDVLGCRYELASLGIDLSDEVEELNMEWEVLDVIGEADDADDELN